MKARLLRVTDMLREALELLSGEGTHPALVRFSREHIGRSSQFRKMFNLFERKA